MHGSETMIPIYFAKWHPNLEMILTDINDSFITDEKAGTAVEAMFNSISASGYQVVVATAQALPKTDVKVVTLHGKLAGTGVEEKLPTIAIVTHYDSFGVASVSLVMNLICFLILAKTDMRSNITVFHCRNYHLVRTAMLPA